MAEVAHSCVAGHFGEFLQGRLGPRGPVALVTLPCPVLTVEARRRQGPFSLYPPRGPVHGPHLIKLLKRLKMPIGGRFVLRAAMPPGGGAGASTASLLAVLRLVAPHLSTQAEAQLCLDAEGATDPLMLTDPAACLWLPRHGLALRKLPAPPAFEIVGGFDGAPQRTRPGDEDFADIADLVAKWCAACDAADHARAGALAQHSARRNIARRGGPALDRIEALAESLGAVGVVAAHTGSARGILFRPGTAPAGAEAALRQLGLGGVLRYQSPRSE